MSVVLSTVAQWRRLSANERRTLLQALLLVPAMHVVVRVIGFNRLQQRIARTTPRRSRAEATAATHLRTCVVSVNRVKRFSVLGLRGNCLSQSLALTWLLRRRGLSPTLRLGARLIDGQFDAHAWVEYDGRVLNDTQDVGARFTPLTERPGAR